MDNETENPAPGPGMRALAMPAATACLALAALGLGLGRDMVHRQLSDLRHDNGTLAQETVMRGDEAERVADLFTLATEDRRRFRLTATAYCPFCGTDDDTPQPAALGGRVRPGRTVAVSRDLKRLLGRKVYIEGLGVRVVEDLMHPRYTGRVDLCLPDREQALAFGVQRLEMVVVD
uniref:3D domain-containing protein n=1 Tax=Desulfovibrio sp. U5L TaxID=596152 RepID=I2Q246_9BACT